MRKQRSSEVKTLALIHMLNGWSWVSSTDWFEALANAFLYTTATQNMVPESAASVSFGSLLEMQNLGGLLQIYRGRTNN